jgi:type IV secretion system protein VirB4
MLTGLVVGVAVTGLVLCFLLWLQVREVSQVSSLKRHRSKQAGLADLLNYAAVGEDGVVICKNGGLLAAWSYQARTTKAVRMMRGRPCHFVSTRLSVNLATVGCGT